MTISPFLPHQIVCLEHESTCLYGEVIQVLTARQLCWVRPLVLAVATDSIWAEPDHLVDLRFTADLFWPIRSFRLALDTEVIPMMAQLEKSNRKPEDERQAKNQLHQFINLVWQTQQKQGRD